MFEPRGYHGRIGKLDEQICFQDILGILNDMILVENNTVNKGFFSNF